MYCSCISVLNEVMQKLEGRPARSRGPTGVATCGTTAPSRLRLTPHRNGLLQNKRGNIQKKLILYSSCLMYYTK